MECLICGNKGFKPYYYPPTIFNNKSFHYFECKAGKPAQKSPLPDDEDMKLMYGTTDHSYLLNLKEGEPFKYTFNYPKYNHQAFQLNFLKKHNYLSFGKTLLDVGCGSGFYMNYAKTLGFACHGIEFSTDFAKLLRSKTGQDIYSFEEFKTLFPEGKQFDIIHLGHVLEHSTEPAIFFNALQKYAHSKTVFIVDGPLEKNKCFSRFVIKYASKLQGKKSNSYPPQHITFTNKNSQLRFFEKAGLVKINYEVAEQMFPFPSSMKGVSFKNKIMFIIGRISVNLSKLFPGSGNIFHYAGQSK